MSTISSNVVSTIAPALDRKCRCLPCYCVDSCHGTVRGSVIGWRNYGKCQRLFGRAADPETFSMLIDSRKDIYGLWGTWDVVSSLDFEKEHLHLTGEPYVTLRQSGKFAKGEYSIGVMSGTINGGANENKEAFSEATLKGGSLTSELWQYHGDEYTFICKRQRQTLLTTSRRAAS